MLLYQETIINNLNKLLNQTPKIRKGTDAVYFCPICKHYKRKLEVNILTGKYHCWVCGFGGLNFKTLFKKLGAPSSYYTFLNESKSFKQNKEFEISFEEEIEKQPTILQLPKEFKPMWEPSSELEYRHALVYLKNRGITKEDVIRYCIGYSTEGDLRNRIIIPSYDEHGALNFYTARSFYDTNNLKYVSCPFSKNIIGFELLVNFEETITLVEGPFDAISVRTNTIPLFGKTLSNKLKMKLLEYDVPMVNVLLDNDAISDAIKICEFLIKNNIKTKLIVLKDKDPSVMGFEKTWELIDSCDTIDFEKLFKLKVTV
jgi:DNA primase